MSFLGASVGQGLAATTATSTTTTITRDSVATLLKIDETAYDFLQNLTPTIPFIVQTSNLKSDNVKFGEMVEVLAQSTEITEFILSSAMGFAHQFVDDNSMILHVSTGNNLHMSLVESGLDISSTPLHKMHREGRVKGFTIQTEIELLAIAELLKSTIQGEKVYLILEGLTGIFLSSKSTRGTMKASSMTHPILRSFGQLCIYHQVIVLWVNSVQPKLGGGLREGNVRDPLTTAWKQKVQRVLYYNPSG